MDEPEFIKGACPKCGGHYEYPKCASGISFGCPHCKVQITLLPWVDGPLVATERKAELFFGDFTTSDGDIHAQFTRSPNQEFTLVWRDNWACGEDKKWGPYYLFIHNKELCKGLIERPNDGQVADNGSFIFCDWRLSRNAGSLFYAFSCTGEILIKRYFRTHLSNASISAEGRFAVCLSLHNKEYLTLYNLDSREEVWHFVPPIRPEFYEFNVPRSELTIRGKSRIYKSCVLSLAQPQGE